MIPEKIQLLDAKALAQRLPFHQLIEGLGGAFAGAAMAPMRQRLDFSRGDEFLIMPAADPGHVGVKLLSVMSDNPSCNIPAIQGLYVLFDRRNGSPVAVMDAAELTARRTAAVSALAAKQLAPENSKRLLLVGSGKLVSYFAEAMRTIRDFQFIDIWARDPVKAEKVANRVAEKVGHCKVTHVDNLQRAASDADVISCLTGATSPLIFGHWLRPGCHLDLVGGYRPDMREANNEVFLRAQIYVDDYEAALTEAGDIISPIKSGVIVRDNILGDLPALASGAGRENMDNITVFKTVGTAAADLYTARIAYQYET